MPSGDRGSKDKVSFFNRLINKKKARIKGYQKLKDESSDIMIRALQDRKIEEVQAEISDFEYLEAHK